MDNSRAKLEQLAKFLLEIEGDAYVTKRYRAAAAACRLCLTTHTKKCGTGIIDDDCSRCAAQEELTDAMEDLE